MKLKSYIKTLVIASLFGGFTASCSDMFNENNGFTIDPHTLTAADTVNYVVGILGKLQTVAVRTNLLGEVRGDLVKVKTNGLKDLKNIANFDFTDIDENRYNNPADYYAMINNCNYFLQYADTNLVVSNKKVFGAEYAAVKYLRAWAYLQLGTIYGENIPFITHCDAVEGVDLNAQTPKKNLLEIVNYFLNEDQLDKYLEQPLPQWGTLDVNVNPKNCFIPGYVIMGDLYLWHAVLTHQKSSAVKAAENYYNYLLNIQNGKNYSSTTSSRVQYSAFSYQGGNYKVAMPMRSSSLYGNTSTYGEEVVSAIGMDSTSAENSYNALRSLYSYSITPDFSEASIIPAKPLFDLSEAQQYCDYNQRNQETFYTKDIDFEDIQLRYNIKGDLRLYNSYQSSDDKDEFNETHTYEVNYKHRSQDITLYRRTEIWLKFAEALNYAGYPRYAASILVRGIDGNVLNNDILPYYSEADQEILSKFQFNNSLYKAAQNYTQSGKRIMTADFPSATRVNIGIHSRGAGLTQINDDYIAMTELQLDSTEYPRDPETGEYLEVQKPTPIPVVKKPYMYEESGFDPETKVVANYPLDEATYKNIYAYYLRYHSEFYDGPGYIRNIDLPNFMIYTPMDSLQTSVLPWYTEGVDYYNDPRIPATDRTRQIDTKYTNYIKASGTGSYATACVNYAEYEKKIVLYNDSLERYNQFVADVNAWRAKACEKVAPQEQANMIQLILNEQALEQAFEGKRYYDLMRNAYWKGSGWGNPDLNVLKESISKRSPEAGDNLTQKNLFLRWKGQIGPM